VLAKMFNELTFEGYCREQEAKVSRENHAEPIKAAEHTAATA
jgi:hypothetical protein